ncbi:tetratricopeptide repeat protein 25 isoform X2 [Esox lucius]|uniref:tetratricopeptide repeat protein 25 isoform X2 n=1 Tax=Esox lucius TaxID=8010 RepID=UPI001476F6D4|nr:tetratricopeptide repeat protein 25 isoform X2 [Esox lucius]
MSDTGGDQGPKSTFSTYMAEGDQLFHKGEYVKAIESYSTGLYQKAEALYTMGDFEFALVFYHRGHKLRPELQEFRLGIQKAQEAIHNSVGSPSSVKLENKGDLSFFHQTDDGRESMVKTVRPTGVIHPLRREMKQQNQKMAKLLLGELYSDKEYLEKLLKDEDLVKSKMRGGERLQDIIVNCITYLDTRTEFWRQQKPIYARERDRKLTQQKWNKSRQNPPFDPTRFVLKNLEEIDAALTVGDAEGSLKKAQEVLKSVQGWSEDVVPNKKEVLGNLHSCIGNALIDLGEMNKALDNHQKDLDLARQYKLPDAMSRALDNVGRVYARIGKFPQAIDAWEEKIPLARGGLERTWLFHEIGRCYLELKRYHQARDYGARSLAAANEIADEKWQLNACVLVAQSEMRLGNFTSSVAHFEKALDRALPEDPARDAIRKALSEARQCL